MTINRRASVQSFITSFTSNKCTCYLNLVSSVAMHLLLTRSDASLQCNSWLGGDSCKDAEVSTVAQGLHLQSAEENHRCQDCRDGNRVHSKTTKTTNVL